MSKKPDITAKLAGVKELADDLGVLIEELRQLRVENAKLRSENERLQALFRSLLAQLEQTEAEGSLDALPPITEIRKLPLATRIRNSLRAGNIEYLGTLITMEREQLIEMMLPNFGKKSLAELEEFLLTRGLTFGMTLPADWESLIPKAE